MFEHEDGTVDGFCYACSTVVEHPLEDRPSDWSPPAIRVKTEAEIAEEIEEILECSFLAAENRGLDQNSMEYFNVRTGMAEWNASVPHEVFFPLTTKLHELARFKVRLPNKAIYHVGRERDWMPFGWEQAVHRGCGKTLFITEGEYDAIALWQAMVKANRGTNWADFYPPVISVTTGAGGAVKELTRHLGEINSHWERVVVVFDMDKPGQKAAQDVARLFKNSCIADLPAKDANACIQEGMSKRLVSAVKFHSKPPAQSRLVRGSALREAAKKRPEWGMPWPWSHLNNATRGRRRGETIYLGAGVDLASFNGDVI